LREAATLSLKFERAPGFEANEVRAGIEIRPATKYPSALRITDNPVSPSKVEL